MSSPDQILSALDPEQRAVATSLDAPTAVIAGAGTGKTRAITHRIAYACATGRYDPRGVLAVTFTTRAAGEMRGRLAGLGVPAVQARTFHSAALRQAQYFWPRAYGSPLPPVSDGRFGMVAEAAGRLRLGAETAQVRDLVSEIGWAKVSNVTPDDYARLAARAGREVAGTDPHVVARVFATYEDIKRERGVIDFDDILLCTAALLSEHPDVADEVRRQYRHFVVDEYQDVSPLQEALLELWVAGRQDLCVVGDPAQTIHTFAGADREFLLRFGHRHPGAHTIELVRDYRSTPEVVDLANSIMRRSGEAVTLRAQREHGPAVGFTESANEADEAAAVADWCAELHADGVDYREMAVLFRINAQSPALEAAFAERDIPYLVRGAERFYERPEVRQALIALRADAKSPDDGSGAVARVRAVLSGLGWQDQAPGGGGAQRERWESLAALVTVAEDLVAEAEAEGVEPPSLDNVVAELDVRAEAQEAPIGQGVTVATLHSAKGLEWDAVALFGIHEGTLPFSLASTPAQIAEERRLLYVGVTRARRHLRISWSRGRTGTAGTRGPARFLDGLTGIVERRSPGRRRARTTALSATCRVCGQHLATAADRKLGRHEGCPSSYDEAVLDSLKTWRKQQADEQRVPAYCVFTDATLVAIAEARPSSEADLIKLPGIGRTKLTRYAADVLKITNE